MSQENIETVRRGIDVWNRSDRAELYAVRGGKVVYRKGFSDPAEALEAAGLRE
jgi:hypothetical protein